MAEKDYTLFGTKVINHKTNEMAIVIYTWKNQFADGTIDFATCINKKGERYNIELDNISVAEVE